MPEMTHRIDSNDPLLNLHLSYAQRLPAKAAEIERNWMAFENSGWEKAAFEHLYSLVHNLHGSAETYGHPEVGAIARQLEDRLKSVCEPTLHDPTRCRPDIERLLGELDRISRRPTAPPDSDSLSK